MQLVAGASQPISFELCGGSKGIQRTNAYWFLSLPTRKGSRILNDHLLSFGRVVV